MLATLDIEQPTQLVDYLRAAGRIGATEQPRVTTLAGGVSNRTVLVERDSGEAWVLKQALEKLRVQADWFSDPARIHREAAGLRWLEKLAPAGASTPLVFEDDAHHLLAMQAVPQAHDNWKHLLLRGEISDDHVDQFADLLVAIHRGATVRPDVEVAFDDQQFFESLRLEPYYAYTATRVPASHSFFDALIRNTRARRLALTHGDFSPKNILVHEGRLILLDHEVIHFGDPAFDVGFSMTHLLSKSHHVSGARHAFARAAQRYWARYRHGIATHGWAGDIEPHAVRHTIGCLLARVDGRSPLEYLTPAQRATQRRAAVTLILDPPGTMSALIRRFVGMT